MKILGIDDNEDLLNLCDIALSSEGYDYTGINNGKDGLEAIKNEKFDLLLLDLSMPDFSGEDVMNELVKDGLMNKQKVVIFTAMSPEKDVIDQFLKQGAHSVLKKHVEPDVLIDFVNKIASEG